MKFRFDPWQADEDAFENDATYHCAGLGFTNCGNVADKGTGGKNIAKSVIKFVSYPDEAISGSIKGMAQLIPHPKDLANAMKMR